MANATTPTKKRLVLVVHGLGEQGPGETLDDLAGGLWGDLDSIHVETDIRQLQEKEHDDRRRLATFPCHVRRYCDLGSRNDPHTTIAEVYWADLSEGDQGAFRIFYGLIKTILGLGHIVRAGAEQYFGANTWAAKTANLVPYIMHGPVAAANVALAAGLILLFGVTKLYGEITDPSVVHGTLLFTGLALIGYGWSQRSSDVYYFRIFVSWTAVFGAVLALLAILELSGWDTSSFKSLLAGTLLAPGIPLDDLVVGPLVYGVALLLCMQIAWIVATVAIILCLVATLIRPKQVDRGDGTPVLIAPLPLILVCAMSWLWMLVVSIMWVSVERTNVFGELLDQRLVHNGVQLLVFCLAGVILVFLGICFTLAKRKQWRRHFKDSPSDINAVFARHPVPRLLLSTPLACALAAAGLLLSIAAGYALAQLLGWSAPASGVGEWNARLLPSAIATAGIIGALAYSQREGIAQALDVGADLIAYFKVEPVPVGKGQPGGTSHKMHGFSSPANYLFEDFRHRCRIHARMQRVLSACWEDSFEELIVASHSQGTIIATEFAKELQNTTSSLIPPGVRERLGPIMQKATLVTMGSPFTHIYNCYFPDQFRGPASISQGTMIKEWINIFRIDDFIGTYIGDADLRGQWPKNHAVPECGHTGYWKDANVIAHLRPLLN